MITVININPLTINEVKKMKDELVKIECDPKCGFMIQSHNEEEVIEAGMNHMKKIHNQKDTTRADVKKMVEKVN